MESRANTAGTGQGVAVTVGLVSKGAASTQLANGHTPAHSAGGPSSLGNMMPFPNRKYQIIYADPPWKFTGLGSKGIRSGKMREDKPNLHRTIRLEEKYPTMTADELKALPVKELAADNAVLFLWTTDAHLPLAIEVMRAWGFDYATVAFVWNKKERSGKQVCYYGYWTMKGTELCLLGRRGKVKPVGHNVRQLVEAVRRNHSEKPDEVRDRIVQLMGDLPRIELFARKRVPGWDAWGNEVEDWQPAGDAHTTVATTSKQLAMPLAQQGVGRHG